MKSWISVTLTALLALGLSACNTVAGVGKDLQKAGESIERSVDKK